VEKRVSAEGDDIADGLDECCIMLENLQMILSAKTLEDLQAAVEIANARQKAKLSLAVTRGETAERCGTQGEKALRATQPNNAFLISRA
jgi:hypothetical protein